VDIEFITILKKGVSMKRYLTVFALVLMLFFSGCASIQKNPEKFEVQLKTAYDATYYALNFLNVLFPRLVPDFVKPAIGIEVKDGSK
jgi:PBP1b-binding outer membrane lipoprotein LpoB